MAANPVSEAEARVIIAANGGSDLIYVPHRDKDLVASLVTFLAERDYVGGIFVDDSYGRIPGALPLSDIGLYGGSPLPRPTIAVTLKVFYLKPGDLQSAIQVTDANLAQGQGMHGGLGRESTFNNMAAIGPHFKRRFVDNAPVSPENS